MDRQTDRQTDRQMDRQTEGHLAGVSVEPEVSERVQGPDSITTMDHHDVRTPSSMNHLTSK